MLTNCHRVWTDLRFWLSLQPSNRHTSRHKTCFSYIWFTLLLNNCLLTLYPGHFFFLFCLSSGCILRLWPAIIPVTDMCPVQSGLLKYNLILWAVLLACLLNLEKCTISFFDQYCWHVYWSWRNVQSHSLISAAGMFIEFGEMGSLVGHATFFTVRAFEIPISSWPWRALGI